MIVRLRCSVTFAMGAALSLCSVGCASAVNGHDDARQTDATTGVDVALPRGDDWQGYLESFRFGSGSDHVRIVFDVASGDGPRSGVVIFGEGSVPPVTDPTLGYPPSFDPMTVPSLTIEGFRYPIINGLVTGSRVQLAVNLSAPWADWCALQMSVAQDSTGQSFGCLPNAPFATNGTVCSYTDPMTHTQVAVDCTRLYLCRTARVCACDASSCRAGSIGQVTFDFQVTAGRGDGTVMLDSLHNVHLTRH